MSYFAHKVNQCRKSPFVFFDLIAQFLKKKKMHASQFCHSHVTYGSQSGLPGKEWRATHPSWKWEKKHYNNMGRRKKADISWRNNLSKAQPSHATSPPPPVPLPNHMPIHDATPIEDTHPPFLSSKGFLNLESCGSASSVCSDEDIVILNDNGETGEATLASFT